MEVDRAVGRCPEFGDTDAPCQARRIRFETQSGDLNSVLGKRSGTCADEHCQKRGGLRARSHGFELWGKTDDHVRRSTVTTVGRTETTVLGIGHAG